MSRICIIPARGGSTRIPKKNIRPFLGKPLIAWSIEHALKTGLFERVIVTTDSEEIAAVAREYGAEVPFRRDPALSDNYVSSYAAVIDAYKRVRDDGKQRTPITMVACFYATAPLMDIRDVEKGVTLIEEGGADYVYSCCEFPFPIQRAVYLDREGAPHPFMPDCIPLRSQDLTKAYQDAAQFYLYRPRLLEGDQARVISRALPVRRFRVVDIDEEDDFILAEALGRAIKEGGHADF